MRLDAADAALLPTNGKDRSRAFCPSIETTLICADTSNPQVIIVLFYYLDYQMYDIDVCIT